MTVTTFGLRPFSGLWTTTRFRQAEQWLGRPIGTTVRWSAATAPTSCCRMSGR